MSNFFTKADYNLECGIHEFKDIISEVETDEYIFSEDEFYDISSHPLINNPFKEEQFDIKKDNPEFVVYRDEDEYHIYIERTDEDLTGWVVSKNSYESLGSVPSCYLNRTIKPIKGMEFVGKGKISDIDKDDPKKVFDLIKNNVIV